MHPEVRRGLFTLSVDEVSAMLGLTARGVVDLVERGLLEATLPSPLGRSPSLDEARFRADQAHGLVSAPAEVARSRGRVPVTRTPDFDRATALGALLRILGR